MTAFLTAPGNSGTGATPGEKYEGHLRFPWGYGVVLTNITRLQFERSGMAETMPSHRVICRDEMTESADAATFQKRLWDMFSVRFQSQLALPEVERIRWLLFPEIRIHQQGLPIEAEAGDARPPDSLQVMDLAQEAIARGLGDGHRVIHGVAGSGKTLAAWLQHQMALRGLADRVTVRNFHGSCNDMLRLYHVPRPADGGKDFYPALVNAVIQAVDRGQIPRAQYGALLIDEGHDFEPDWLRLVVQMLDPESNQLLLLYDDAQSIYGAKRKGFTFRSVGVSAVGRTKILKRNYRNTNEILACAAEFARELLQEVDSDEDSVPLVAPVSGGRSGCQQPRRRRFSALSARRRVRVREADVRGHDTRDARAADHQQQAQQFQRAPARDLRAVGGLRAPRDHSVVAQGSGNIGARASAV